MISVPGSVAAHEAVVAGGVAMEPTAIHGDQFTAAIVSAGLLRIF
jgi:hypothetical protein